MNTNALSRPQRLSMWALGLSALLALTLAACGGGKKDPVELDANGNPVNPATACKSDELGSTLSTEDWLSAWGSTRTTGPAAPTNTTVRNIVRVTASGDRIRLRFFNLSDNPIVIGAASVAIRSGSTGAAVDGTTLVPVTFSCGQTAVTIPPQTESFYSDPIAMKVGNQQDLAVSLFLPGTLNPSEFGTGWSYSYKLPNGSGDATANSAGANYGLIDGSTGLTPAGVPLACDGCQVYALRDVEVISTEADGAMVFLGSSSIHGYNTTQDSHRRFPDQISVKAMSDVAAGKRKSVVNRGIGGDTLQAASATRLMRDLYSTAKVHSVVLWATNDLGSRTADQIIANYEAVIDEAHAKGIHVFCPTWIPGAQSLQASANGERQKLNTWILTSKRCDGVVDYNAVVEAPGGLTLLPQYNSGDSIHSNDAGHTEWTRITPVKDWMEMARRVVVTP